MPEPNIKNAVHQDMIWRDTIITEHKCKQRFNNKNDIVYTPPAEDKNKDQRVAIIGPQKHMYHPRILTDINLEDLEEGLFRPDQYLKGKNGLK
ncbi:hypothetical protein SS50377_25879 [Spironucleus salmonicida]|uniref:Uncharacterized protein n=1 Tax=Spironucleus salmonicida TaxID=348837 RepID=V6LUB3_9EUKA|nr:hypothetical protein SS50377_25879 [Spironucleus salmonicida]|eukprot:EST48212.1 Hypothetical protein SS50377_11653 [Spironucleus salmonicida]